MYKREHLFRLVSFTSYKKSKLFIPFNKQVKTHIFYNYNYKQFSKRSKTKNYKIHNHSYKIFFIFVLDSCMNDSFYKFISLNFRHTCSACTKLVRSTVDVSCTSFGFGLTQNLDIKRHSNVDETTVINDKHKQTVSQC